MNTGDRQPNVRGPAATFWADALEKWAIPEEILAAAPESPWGFPTPLFVENARRALEGPPTPTHRRVAEALPEAGVLLDVGAGAGAASLPVAPRDGRLVALDQHREMLTALADLARSLDRTFDLELVEGQWPRTAHEVGTVDVALCANVAYNVADLSNFLAALTHAARHRVVLELSASHPQSPLSPLWQHFWGFNRPDRPRADDAIAVVREVIGVAPGVQRWQRRSSFIKERGPDTARWVRQRLCLPPSREPEVATLLGRMGDLAPPEAVTLWWSGGAPARQ